MPRGLYIDKPQSVALREYEDAPLLGDQVRIRTEFASIKHGTEFHLFSGQSPFGGRYFDPALRLFVGDGGAKSQDRAVGQFVGNMAVGVVSEVGSAATRFGAGDLVYCYGPLCETQAEAEVQPLAPSMTTEDAVCTDPAFYALAALRDARVCLGDAVVVFGLGAIGLLLVQVLTRAGCLQVIAVDPLPRRRDLAAGYGASLTLDPAHCDVAMEVRRHLGVGADIAVEVRDYPLWDEARLSQTITQFFLNGALTSDGIVDPIAPFAEATQAFLDVYHDSSQAIKLGIRF